MAVSQLRVTPGGPGLGGGALGQMPGASLSRWLLWF